MFYEVKEGYPAVAPEEINPEVLTAGCVTPEELAGCAALLGFDGDTVELSRRANPLFRTGVDVRETYTFAELRVINRDGHEDSVSLYVKRNLLLIVDIIDEDGSTVDAFLRALKKYPPAKTGEERILYSFMESLLSEGVSVSEELRNRLTDMEESIIRGDAGERFNADLLSVKKTVQRYLSYYGQMQDVAEALEENENEILCENSLMYVANLTGRVTRLLEDMNALNSSADHIQDAYAALLDLKMNSTMKIFTVITSVFFPLTIIVGWYGMNFRYMPELSWKYGYLYVTVLSVAVVAVLIFVGRRKKWF